MSKYTREQKLVIQEREAIRDRVQKMRNRWQELSHCCWCASDDPSHLCSACRGQDTLKKEAERLGYNIYTGNPL